MTFSAEIAPLVEEVLAFAHAVNAWEARMHVRSRMEAGQYVRDRAIAEQVSQRTYDEVLAEYADLVAQHCTPRQRDVSWSREGKFVGASAQAVIAASVFDSRAEVCIECGQFPGQRYKFVLCRDRGEWRIHEVLSNSGLRDEWHECDL